MLKLHAKILGSLFAVGLAAGGFSTPAAADLKLCNETKSRVGVALGYKDQAGWKSEGWWNVGPSACVVVLKGSLIARYYYIYAIDYDKGGSWGGKAMFCTQDKVFTIQNAAGRNKDCSTAGRKKTGFFEVDTGEETDWSVTLSGEKTSQ